MKRRRRRRRCGDLHNVYYANLGQRGCINKCYIIIQIKCFNLHTFYRPPVGMRNASPARGTRVPHAARWTRARRLALLKVRRACLERNSFRGGSLDDDFGRGARNSPLHIYFLADNSKVIRSISLRSTLAMRYNCMHMIYM